MTKVGDKNSAIRKTRKVYLGSLSLKHRKAKMKTDALLCKQLQEISMDNKAPNPEELTEKYYTYEIWTASSIRCTFRQMYVYEYTRPPNQRQEDPCGPAGPARNTDADNLMLTSGVITYTCQRNPVRDVNNNPSQVDLQQDVV